MANRPDSDAVSGGASHLPADPLRNSDVQDAYMAAGFLDGETELEQDDIDYARDALRAAGAALEAALRERDRLQIRLTEVNEYAKRRGNNADGWQERAWKAEARAEAAEQQLQKVREWAEESDLVDEETEGTLRYMLGEKVAHDDHTKPQFATCTGCWFDGLFEEARQLASILDPASGDQGSAENPPETTPKG